MGRCSTRRRPPWRRPALDAEVSDVLRMPEDSLLPLLLALAATGVCYGLLLRSAWMSALAAGLVLVLTIAWLWPSRGEREAWR